MRGISRVRRAGSARILVGVALVAGATTGASAAFAGPPLFASAYRAYDGVAANVSVSDVDRDGLGDLVSNQAVFLSLPAGGFAAPLPFDAPGGAPRPVIIDVDGDGLVDLIQALPFDSLLAFRRGLGSGRFAAARLLGVGMLHGQPAAGDLDGDGKIDLAVPADNQVTILFQDAEGNFNRRESLRSGLYPVAAAIADLDGDGDADLAIACTGANGYVSIHRNRGHGIFEARTDFALQQRSQRIAAADVTGDGLDDLVLGGDFVVLLVNQGQAEFAGPLRLRIGDFALADFDGDGADDIAIGPSYYGGPEVAIFRDRGGNLTQDLTVPISKSTFSIGAGDLDGDARADLIVCGDASIDVFRNRDGGFSEPGYWLTGLWPYWSGPGVFGDFNRDGHADVASVDVDAIDLAYGSGNGTFTVRDNVIPSIYESSVGVLRATDLDGDGMIDILIGRSTSCGYRCHRASVGWARQTLAGFASEVELPVSVGAFAAGDGNGDGTADIVGFQKDAISGYDLLTLYPGTGGGGFGMPIRSLLSERSRYYGRLELADVNHDRLPDVILSDGICPGLGGGLFGAAIRFRDESSSGDFAVGDLNGDGLLDLVGTADGSGPGIALRFGNGDGTFRHGGTLAGPGYGPFAIGDVTADGNPDIAAGTNVTVVFVGAGGGVFSDPEAYGGTVAAIGFIDVDEDGLPDLVSQGAVLRNLGREVDRSPPIVHVESPNGGEVLEMGRAFEIRWDSSDPSGIAGVDLDLILDTSSGLVQPLAQNLPGTGTYMWTPQHQHVGSARIRATAHDVPGNVGADVSDKPFRIDLPPLTLSRFEVNYVNASIELNWEVRPPESVGAVDILRLDREGDSAVPRLIAGQQSATGSASDTEILSGRTYGYQVRVFAKGERVMESAPVWTRVPGSPEILESFQLSLATRPNPSNAEITFAFELPERDHVRMSIHDLSGREVAVIVDGERPRGRHSVAWRAIPAVPPGIYFVRLRTSHGDRTRRVSIAP